MGWIKINVTLTMKQRNISIIFKLKLITDRLLIQPHTSDVNVFTFRYKLGVIPTCSRKYPVFMSSAINIYFHKARDSAYYIHNFIYVF